VWTPRRLTLMLLGLLLFGGGFSVYSQLFGWIDGLPPLPPSYMKAVIEGSNIAELPGGVTPIQARLRQAFGQNCIEQSYNLKFEAREKGLLFAAADAKILEDGRVLLQQMSVAVFGKTNKELTTIHADRAWLTFDKPVRKIDDMGARKVTAAELHSDPDFPTNDPRRGKVHLLNNRRTPEPDDDLLMKTPGPLYYVDAPKPNEPHIWTLNAVELVDRHNRPAPTQPESLISLPTVTAEGMRVYLIEEVPNAPKKPEPKQANAVGSVERIELDRQVLMHIWTESRNMLGSDAPKETQPKKTPGVPVEKVLLTIQTNGPFTYNLVKDLAHFEVPPQREPGLQEYVKVTRKAKGNSEDTLTSDFLDVQFMRRRVNPPTAAGKQPPPKPPTPKAGDPAATQENDLEIEMIHAWGKNIALSSDSDSLFVYGFDLVYDARIKQTTVKGAPMHAVKDGNLIRAPELILANLDDKEKQHARAIGPGVIGMGEFDPRTQEYSRQAHWSEWLVVSRVKEQGKDLDYISLTGDARFIDTLNDQKLRGRILRLWIHGRDTTKPITSSEPKKVVKPVAKKIGPNGKPIEEKKQPLPHRLEAVGDVTVYSPELIVEQSEYLNIWFKDLPPGEPPMIEGPGQGPARDPALIPPPLAKGQEVPKKIDPVAPIAKKTPEKRSPPMIVRKARRLVAWVNRVDGKNDLDKAHAEGDVVIHQDPANETEKGIDITGHTVDVEHHLEGNKLVVAGTEQSVGVVHFDKVSIMADDIKIDQRDNSANVKGAGSMRLLSQSDLKGEKLAKPTYIDIYWSHAMDLDGPIQSVRYEGSVTAKQNDATVLCETMQVWLDRPLYLNQNDRAKDIAANPGKKGEPRPSPKIVKVLCDQQVADGAKKPAKLLPVSVEDMEKAGATLIRYQNIQGREVEMDNVLNKMISIGPGTVRIWQAGSKDPLGDPKEKPKLKKKGDDNEMKYTFVSFDQRMTAYNNIPKRAIFRSNVEVVHMPSDTHEAKFDIAKLPEHAVHLKCEKELEITTQTRKSIDANGKPIEIKWQEMKAEGNVRVRGEDYEGWAGVVTYTEEKSLLVFTGTPSNPATLSRVEIKGGERKTFRGEKITYNVKTKDCNIDGSTGGASN